MTGSKDKFKIQLDKFLKKIPDEPQIPGYTQAKDKLIQILFQKWSELVSTRWTGETHTEAKSSKSSK